MAKYDWKQLEKDYLLGDFKSVSAFLKYNGINNNGTIRKYTAGWKDKKRQKEDKIKTKTIEKTIEKQSDNDSNNNVSINNTAIKLLDKINTLNDINERNIKIITSALKDINDILKDNNKSKRDIEDLTVLADLFGFGDKK